MTPMLRSRAAFHSGVAIAQCYPQTPATRAGLSGKAPPFKIDAYAQTDMKRPPAVLMPVLMTVVLLPAPGGAQTMEVIGLRHRSAAEVAEALRPLLADGGKLSAMGDKLIVQTSAGNLRQIRTAVAAIDRPLRRLRITVVQDGGADGGAGAWSSRSGARHAQQVQVIEGGRAFVAVGQSLPLPLTQLAIGPDGVAVSQGIVWRDLATGFYAAPRVQGDRVTLEISPQQESADPAQAGGVHGARLQSTVSGRFGEWIELGGSSGEVRQEGGDRRWSTRGSLRPVRVRLMVEEMR
jgi:hypothetical protein